MQDFRKWRVWHKAQELAVEIYRFTADFPCDEKYGLASQLRKASVSVGSNTAEGSKRAARNDKARFINIAQGSAAEVMSELDMAGRLQYGAAPEIRRLSAEYDELCGMLENLRRRIKEQRDEVA